MHFQFLLENGTAITELYQNLSKDAFIKRSKRSPDQQLIIDSVIGIVDNIVRSILGYSTPGNIIKFLTKNLQET